MSHFQEFPEFWGWKMLQVSSENTEKAIFVVKIHKNAMPYAS